MINMDLIQTINETYVAMLERHLDECRTRIAEGPSCACICHRFPKHGKLQDALESLKWHQEEVERLKRPWKVVLAVSTTDRVELSVIDVGHSDHILTVECQKLQF